MTDTKPVEKIIFVDDEINILNAIKRQFHNTFEMDFAISGEEALKLFKDNQYAVIVTDMRMPQMNGLELLEKVKFISPDTVRMVLTGFTDVETTLGAVNQGNVFRFITKPWPTDSLKKMIVAGIRQYNLIRAEKELLEKTLSGVISLLNNILAIVHPIAMEKTQRISYLVQFIINKLNIEDSWQYEVAAMLSQIGCISLTGEIILKQYKENSMSAEEKEIFDSHPLIAKNLIERIPRLGLVANIVGNQFKTLNELKNETELKINTVLIGSQILKVANDFDNGIVTGYTKEEILNCMKTKQGQYHAKIVSALDEYQDIIRNYEIKSLKVHELHPLMITEEQILSKNGMKLLEKSFVLTPTVIEILRTYSKGVGIREPVRVRVPVMQVFNEFDE